MYILFYEVSIINIVLRAKAYKVSVIFELCGHMVFIYSMAEQNCVQQYSCSPSSGIFMNVFTYCTVDSNEDGFA